MKHIAALWFGTIDDFSSPTRAQHISRTLHMVEKSRLEVSCNPQVAQMECNPQVSGNPKVPGSAGIVTAL